MSEPVDHDEQVHNDLIRMLDEWSTAIVSNDAERIAQFMADDWVIVSSSGPSSKAEFLSVVRSGALTHSAMDRVSSPTIRLQGDVAVVTARVTNTAHYEGQRFDADEWTTDVLVRRGDRWLCIHSHITNAAAPPEG